MRSLTIPSAPTCLTDMASARPNGPWFDGRIREERVARQWVRRKLLRNQQSTCGWCGAKITFASSHAEHICPKGNPTYASLTFEISNLIACCGTTTSSTCGHHKQERVLAAWVHPYHTGDLESRFTYEIDGKMTPRLSIDPAEKQDALHAIDTLLNLNHSVLKSKREAQIADILTNEIYSGLSHDQIFAIIGEFKPLIQQYA